MQNERDIDTVETSKISVPLLKLVYQSASSQNEMTACPLKTEDLENFAILMKERLGFTIP